MPWSNSTGSEAALLLLLALPATAWAGDPLAAAQAAGGAVQDKLGSAEGFRVNAAVPLTSPGRDLFTIDDTGSGRVRIGSPSSEAFLSLVAQPGATGDLAAVRVDQDLDFDGSADSVYLAPMPVSGVCANGIVSCDPGTWLHCAPFAWSADSSGRVTLQPCLLNELGGCYCINQSCGSRLVWDNIGLVMKDLGGGAAGAVQAVKDSYVVTAVKTDGPSISYYGRDTSDPASFTGSAPEVSYFTAAGSLDGDARAEAVSQSADPDSFYSMMSGSFNARGTSTERRTCARKRHIALTDWCHGPLSAGQSQASGACGAGGAQVPTVVFDWQVTYRLADRSTDTLTGSQTRTLCTDHLMFTRIRQDPSGQTLFVEWAGTDPSGTVIGWNCGGPFVSWLTIDTVNLPPEVREWEGRVNVSYSGGGCAAGSAVVTGYWCDQTCEAAENESSTCEALESDADCELLAEEVDGVVTFRNFNPTGLAPLPSTRTVAAGSCSDDFTRNWWEKELTFQCTADAVFSFDDLARRTGSIAGSLDANAPGTATVAYTDRRLDPETGAWIVEGGSIDLPDTGSGPGCEQVCKTRRPAEDTQAGQAGPATEYRTGNQGWDFFYRTCDDGGNCPAGPGEEILKECQCLDEFAEATSILLSLEAASKDIICSDGVPK